MIYNVVSLSFVNYYNSKLKSEDGIYCSKRKSQNTIQNVLHTQPFFKVKNNVAFSSLDTN